MKPTAHDLERFWAKVQQTDGCWLWLGSKSSGGYGTIPWQGVTRSAHAVSWEIANSTEIPAGLEAAHLCNTPLCVRPDHVVPMPHWRNMQMAQEQGRLNGTHKETCIRGHAYTPENTYTMPNGYRTCRECKRLSDRERYALYGRGRSPY